MAPKGLPADRMATLRQAFTSLQGDKTFKRLMSRLGENSELQDGADYEKTRPDKSAAYKELVKQITGK